MIAAVSTAAAKLHRRHGASLLLVAPFELGKTLALTKVAPCGV
jgi:hypothetical protein